ALARARWTFEEAFDQRIHARGYEDFRHSDVTVIARLPADGGARISELAERAAVTKQAIGKSVKSLEARGYVERRPDPDDGRAQRVVLSERGMALLNDAREVIAAIEAEWAEVLGAAGLTRLRRALLTVSDELGPAEYL
ncbi:MarR family winged helix-turn-helix transcriptional regulator, partial [Synechococcus sp. CS-205]|uniref:MarR family winged helix-turn-helix transcriptional regulator n=1 Tax=Synechococcus sp. CS-205 TaxID=2847984 RepID=UPI00223C26B2